MMMGDDDDDEAQKWANLEAEMSRPDPALAFTGADPVPSKPTIEHEPDDDGPEWRRTYRDKYVYSDLTPAQLDAAGNDLLFEDYVHDDGTEGVLATLRTAAPTHTLTHEHERTEIGGRVIDIYRRRA